MKKAGTIVGVIIILVAVGIYWWTQHLGHAGAGGTNHPSAPVVATNTSSPVTSSSNQSLPQQTSSIPKTQVQTQTDPTPTHVFSSVSPSSLGKPSSSSTEIMIVSDKKVVVLDSAYGTNSGKQLAYAVDLIYSKGKMRLFVSGNTFSTLAVGAKLNVTYDIYTNSKGVTFPVIMNATNAT